MHEIKKIFVRGGTPTPWIRHCNLVLTFHHNLPVQISFNADGFITFVKIFGDDTMTPESALYFILRTRYNGWTTVFMSFLCYKNYLVISTCQNKLTLNCSDGSKISQQGVGATPKAGASTFYFVYFWQFSRKLHGNVNIGRTEGVCVLGAPLHSPISCYSVADLEGREECAPPLSPINLIFMQFSGKIILNNQLTRPFWVGASPGKSLIRHWLFSDLIFFCKITSN